jgi:hypothetical protein
MLVDKLVDKKVGWSAFYLVVLKVEKLVYD